MSRMIALWDNPVEIRRQAIQANLDTRKSAAERNRLGQFATPNALAVDIARYVESVLGQTHGKIRFADPSIGSGSFFPQRLQFLAPNELTAPSVSSLIPHSPMPPALCGPMPGLKLCAAISRELLPAAHAHPHPTSSWRTRPMCDTIT